jgi:hypothetical protein
MKSTVSSDTSVASHVDRSSEIDKVTSFRGILCSITPRQLQADLVARTREVETLGRELGELRGLYSV